MGKGLLFSTFFVLCKDYSGIIVPQCEIPHTVVSKTHYTFFLLPSKQVNCFIAPFRAECSMALFTTRNRDIGCPGELKYHQSRLRCGLFIPKEILNSICQLKFPSLQIMADSISISMVDHLDKLF